MKRKVQLKKILQEISSGSIIAPRNNIYSIGYANQANKTGSIKKIEPVEAVRPISSSNNSTDKNSYDNNALLKNNEPKIIKSIGQKSFNDHLKDKNTIENRKASLQAHTVHNINLLKAGMGLTENTDIKDKI